VDQSTGGTGPRLADAVLDRLREALADRYELLRELGRGGMATEYVARDRKHGREVALKVMDPALAKGVGAARFLREVRIAATLTHPGIVPVFDSGEVGDPFYYVMPLLRGASLRDRMRAGPIAPREACLLLAEVADALDAAHRANVVHRDVKPENILIADGRPLVTDFGVAHAAPTDFGDSLTDTGVSVGTLLYMAPEQLFDAANTDARADVFSVGAMLYEMLSGAPPCTAPTMPAAMARLAAEPTPPLPETLPVSAELRAVVARATARDPEARFASAHELADALRAAALLEATSSSAPRLIARSTRRVSRRTLIGAAAVLLVLLAGIAVIVLRLRGGASDAGAMPPSLAVLSFENTSHDPKLAYFSDGIAQELQNALAELPGLSVASRTATDVWRGRAADPREIARALGVTDLLEGAWRGRRTACGSTCASWTGRPDDSGGEGDTTASSPTSSTCRKTSRGRWPASCAWRSRRTARRRSRGRGPRASRRTISCCGPTTRCARIACPTSNGPCRWQTARSPWIRRMRRHGRPRREHSTISHCSADDGRPMCRARHATPPRTPWSSIR
jgi:serine/threonine-protein kinase